MAGPDGRLDDVVDGHQPQRGRLHCLSMSGPIGGVDPPRVPLCKQPATWQCCRGSDKSSGGRQRRRPPKRPGKGRAPRRQVHRKLAVSVVRVRQSRLHMHRSISAGVQHSPGMAAYGIFRRCVPLTPLNLDFHSVTSQAMLNSAGDVAVLRTSSDSHNTPTQKYHKKAYKILLPAGTFRVSSPPTTRLPKIIQQFYFGSPWLRYVMSLCLMGSQIQIYFKAKH